MSLIILHAWYSNSKSNWYPWLKKELEKKDYQVYLPELPTMNTDLPNMELQLKTIMPLIDKDTTVIGHSLSCLLAMRVAERKSYKKMILVAGWDINDLTKEHKLFWQNMINHNKIKKNTEKIYCLSSDNDPYFTAYQTKEMSRRFGGQFILIKGAGHFTKNDKVIEIPQILSLI